jgi:Peptide N-acetyl-beta-D-glucosaminyl asparaginase amidase A
MPRGVCLVRNLVPLLLVVTILIPFASASGPYVIGSANTVTADPNVTRPSTTPCVVQLFTNMGFDYTNYNLNPYSYAPPTDCPGPWAKVVFEADINVTAGIQYDRTINVWLGATNIYFGTTSEPGPTLAPSWHVENDLTDYSSIFYAAQTGSVFMGNNLCCGLDGLIYASASLEFYPLAEGQTAPVVAGVVLPLSGGSSGGTVALNTTSSTLSGTFTMPTNVQSAYLDVYAQSQSDDEFWYTCVPNDVASELESCGNTGFRETEITIDGQPAGIAPVFPWIFTGGIDPYLWFPIPGVQTMNFTPYRVNLTPFAGLLSNGQPHTVSLSVYNADSYFSATASLLLYLDSGTTQVTGAITENTLAGPSPVVTENLNVQPTSIHGTVDVSSNRSFVISGYANTSQGTVTTKVSQTINFSNDQYFNITNTVYTQDITQGSTLSSTTVTSGGGAATTVNTQTFNFPLTVDISEVVQSNGNINLTTNARQNYTASVTTKQANQVTYTSSMVNTGQHIDTLEFDSSFNFLGNTGQSSSQQYNYWDSTSAAYVCDLAAVANVLTYFSEGCTQ